MALLHSSSSSSSSYLRSASVSITFVFLEDKSIPWHFAFFPENPLGPIQLLALDENSPFTDNDKRINEKLVRDFPRPQSVRPDSVLVGPDLEAAVAKTVETFLFERDGVVGCEDQLTRDYLTRLLPLHQESILITGKNPCTSRALLEQVRMEAEGGVGDPDLMRMEVEPVGGAAEEAEGEEYDTESFSEAEKKIMEEAETVLKKIKERKEEENKKRKNTEKELSKSPVIELS